MEGSKDEAMADTTSTSPPPPIPIGARVELKGLQAKPELNGQTGIVRSFVPSTGRCVVKMDGGAPMKIKPQNLVRITEESLAEAAGMLSLNSSCYDLGFVDVPSRLELDVTGDDDQSMLESLVRIATAKKPAKEDVKYWGGASEPWRNGTDDSAITDPDVIAREEQRKSEAEEEDAVAATGDDVGNHADRLHGFGLQITFLLLLTHELKLWAWKTWEVVQFLVKPATEQHGNRCRFAELPLVERFTGPATVFASHCWGGLWGDLVAAVCAGADKRRVVWIDVFAVRQWPGNGADLDFRGVIARSNATIVAMATVIGKLTEEDDPLRLETSVKSPVGRAAFLASDEYKQASKSLAFCRLWCLVELFATIQAGKGLVFRGACAGKISERRVSLLGTAAAEVAGDDKFKAMLRNAPKVGREGLLSMLAAQNETFVAVARSVWAEEDAKEAAGGDQRGGITVAMIQRMMINCSCIIDVSTASCAVPADRERELAAIELEAEAMGGLEYVNRVVASGVYAGARIANLKTAEGDNFVCGEEEGLRALSPDSLFPALQGAVVADRVGLLEALLEGPLRLQVRSMLCGSTRFNGFLITAAGNDCCAVVERLLREPGVDVNNSDASGRTAVGIACTESHVNVLKQLLDCPRLDPNKKMSFMGDASESPLQTALQVAKVKQHDDRSVAVLRLLIAHPKVDVNAKIDANGLSPLGFAIKLNSLPAVKLLVDHQRVDLNLAMTEYGLTPLHMAGVGNREDIVKLLLEKGADATIQTRLGATALALAQERGHSEIVSILRRVEEEAAMGGLAVGVRVELRGLKAKPELNGHRGVVEKYVASSGRFAVRVDDGLGSFCLKSDNLAIL